MSNKTLILSTGHVPEFDGVLLSAASSLVNSSKDNPNGHVSHVDEYGVTFSFPKKGEWELLSPLIDTLNDFGFSVYLVSLVYKAYSEGYTVLKLDRDADIHDNLPVFDW